MVSQSNASDRLQLPPGGRTTATPPRSVAAGVQHAEGQGGERVLCAAAVTPQAEEQGSVNAAPTQPSSTQAAVQGQPTVAQQRCAPAVAHRGHGAACTLSDEDGAGGGVVPLRPTPDSIPLAPGEHMAATPPLSGAAVAQHAAEQSSVRTAQTRLSSTQAAVQGPPTVAQQRCAPAVAHRGHGAARTLSEDDGAGGGVVHLRPTPDSIPLAPGEHMAATPPLSAAAVAQHAAGQSSVRTAQTRLSSTQAAVQGPPTVAQQRCAPAVAHRGHGAARTLSEDDGAGGGVVPLRSTPDSISRPPGGWMAAHPPLSVTAMTQHAEGQGGERVLCAAAVTPQAEEQGSVNAAQTQPSSTQAAVQGQPTVAQQRCAPAVAHRGHGAACTLSEDDGAGGGVVQLCLTPYSIPFAPSGHMAATPPLSAAAVAQHAEGQSSVRTAQPQRSSTQAIGQGPPTVAPQRCAPAVAHRGHGAARTLSEDDGAGGGVVPLCLTPSSIPFAPSGHMAATPPLSAAAVAQHAEGQSSVNAAQTQPSSTQAAVQGPPTVAQQRCAPAVAHRGHGAARTLSEDDGAGGGVVPLRSTPDSISLRLVGGWQHPSAVGDSDDSTRRGQGGERVLCAAAVTPQAEEQGSVNAAQTQPSSTQAAVQGPPTVAQQRCAPAVAHRGQGAAGTLSEDDGAGGGVVPLHPTPDSFTIAPGEHMATTPPLSAAAVAQHAEGQSSVRTAQTQLSSTPAAVQGPPTVAQQRCAPAVAHRGHEAARTLSEGDGAGGGVVPLHSHRTSSRFRLVGGWQHHTLRCRRQR